MDLDHLVGLELVELLLPVSAPRGSLSPRGRLFGRSERKLVGRRLAFNLELGHLLRAGEPLRRCRKQMLEGTVVFGELLREPLPLAQLLGELVASANCGLET
jgi:hypothetical protein